MNPSKVIVLYVAPWVALTAFLLFLLVYLAPVVLLQTRVAMLTVTHHSSDPLDGPSVFLGALGSCSRATSHAGVECTSPSLNPAYDLSDSLPPTAPHFLLSAPPVPPGFLGLALAYSIIFFVLFTLVSYRHKMGKKSAATLDKPAIQRVLVWLGVSGFLLGFTSFLIMHIWFGKAARDFNHNIVVEGSAGPQLIATVGNAFIMGWVAYGFYGVLVVISIVKLNVKASKWTDF
ncbi:hypothetical protein GGX14DRAFT_635599, partial [Mycena pura]